jgi:hypothetical protein
MVVASLLAAPPVMAGPPVTATRPVTATPPVMTEPGCATTPQVSAPSEYTGDLAGWMACLYPNGSPVASAQRLGDTLLLGAHEAATDGLYALEASAFDYAKRCRTPVDRVAQGVKWISRQWAMKQTLPIDQQASAGARWFDLDAVWHHGRWTSCDSLATDDLSDTVRLLDRFHEQHPGEVLVVDLSSIRSRFTGKRARAMVDLLAPLCRSAVRLADADDPLGGPGRVTITQARAAGGFLLQMANNAASDRWYRHLTDYLGQHPGSPCEGRLWSRSTTTLNWDGRHDANLWINRSRPAEAVHRLIGWNARHLVDTDGSFQVSSLAWDYSGPVADPAYQVWLMNHWLVEYNARLQKSVGSFGRTLWLKGCSLGIRPNVILMDDIRASRQTRELVGYNRAHCPT